MFSRTTILKAVDAGIGPLVCRALSLFHYLRRRGNPEATPVPPVPKRILVIRPGGMGDMILLLPLFHALRDRFPGIEIDVVCEKRNADVLTITGLPLTVLTYDTAPWKMFQHWRHHVYDAAVDTEQFHHFSAVFGFLSGAPVRIGFKINPLRNSLYTHLVNYAPDENEVSQFMRLLEPFGIARPPPYPRTSWQAALPPECESELSAALAGEPFIALHPGSTSFHKLWPVENFALLAQRLHAEHHTGMVLLGGPSDKKDADRLVDAMRENHIPVVSFTGKLKLPATAAMIRKATLFVGSDSGLAHLAGAMDVPSVVLFGPTDPVKWGLADERRLIVRHTMPCAPCFIFGYHKPCRTAECMRKIEVSDVADACNRLLP